MKLKEYLIKEFKNDVSHFGFKQTVILYFLFIFEVVFSYAAVLISYFVDEGVGMLFLMIPAFIAVLAIIYVIVICHFTKDKKS